MSRSSQKVPEQSLTVVLNPVLNSFQYRFRILVPRVELGGETALHHVGCRATPGTTQDAE